MNFYSCYYFSLSSLRSKCMVAITAISDAYLVHLQNAYSSVLKHVSAFTKPNIAKCFL